MNLQRGTPKFEEVHLHLVSLSEGMKPLHSGSGVCVELVTRFGLRFSYRHKRNLFSKWEFWSGCGEYPVPASPENLDPDDAESAYLGSSILWVNNPYGDLRRQFCRFLADHLEEIEFYEIS